LLKTVVGSFPPKKLLLEKATKWAVDLQLNHDLDIVSDGEQRTDMISYPTSNPRYYHWKIPKATQNSRICAPSKTT
jgi:methionine synthase II (cobalamin-independent)